ncbi:hypothetical protein CEXT_655711 [Caerostris extrusa]|uniref:Uncharacterized protein n=1 Tax=Caerostris extrusa TaxID=172846 RepID=A0AAV4U567_CAEEX|nr:hypothetical protein CEXT_655711 [Caerostris extrusa]
MRARALATRPLGPGPQDLVTKLKCKHSTADKMRIFCVNCLVPSWAMTIAKFTKVLSRQELDITVRLKVLTPLSYHSRKIVQATK